MKNIIEEYLRSQKKKRVETRVIEGYVIAAMGREPYWRQGGYLSFAKAIGLLVDEGVMAPVKAWKTNGLNPSLYNGYQIIAPGDQLDKGIKQELLTQYHPDLNTAYYLKNPKEYQQDQGYLAALDRFLKENPDYQTLPAITANERSFQIFHDEKWLLSGHGQKFRQRVGLSLEDLRCYLTHEPFFYFAGKVPGEGAEINVLIVENKDTFYSLKALFQAGVNRWDNISFTVLIYGEGRKIEKSFPFFWELAEYRPYEKVFYYFGDLDPEGILIWYALRKRQEVEIKPFTFFYGALVERYARTAPKRRGVQRFDGEAVEAFLSFFGSDRVEEMRKILEEERYLPQEGLNYLVLVDLANKQQVELLENDD